MYGNTWPSMDRVGLWDERDFGAATPPAAREAATTMYYKTPYIHIYGRWQAAGVRRMSTVTDMGLSILSTEYRLFVMNASSSLGTERTLSVFRT